MRAPPDGYTLLLIGTANAINATLYDKLNFNFIRDIAPIASVIRGALVMLMFQDASRVHRLCQGEPGQALLRFGSVGGITHITAELFKQQAGGLDILHVPSAP